MDKFLENPLSTARKVALLIVYFVGYLFVFQLLLISIAFALQIDIESNVLLFSFFDYLISVGFAVLIAYPLLKAEIKFHFLQLLKPIGIGLLILFGINIVLGMLISFIFSLETSANQEQLIQIVDSNLLLYFLMVVVLAPILEEIIFRGVIFRHFRQKNGFLTAALISAFAFGFIHVLESLLSGNFLDLVYLLLYGAMGFVFSKTYEDTGTIYGCICLHAIYNMVGFIQMIS